MLAEKKPALEIYDPHDPRLTLSFTAAGTVAERAQTLLRDHKDTLYCRTDRMFAVLMALQWVAGLIASYWISPRTWEGLSSQTHPHVWTAFWLGGAISFFPIALAVWYPGRVMTRHTIAAAQLMMSGLLIHLTGGNNETHFHIFGSLAFLAFYRDWRVLLTASLVTAIDHGLRGFYWPQSIYGVAVVEPWRWVEHVGWVVFTDTFLIVSIRQSVREMRGIAWRQAKQEETEAELQQARGDLERRVHERTEELAQVNAVLERDIVRRHRAETSLRQSEQRLRLALESSRLGTYQIDLTTGRATEISDTCRSQFGQLADADQSTNGFFQAIHPEDEARVQNAFQRAIADRTDYEADFRYIWPDGSIHWISVHGSSIFSETDGAPQMIGVTQDITARKHAELALSDSEQRLRLALESGRLGTWDFDPNTDRYLYTSPFWKTLFGLPPDAEFPRATFFQAIHPDDRRHVQDAFQRSREDGHDYQAEFRCIWPDGSVHWLSGNGSPIRSESGQVIRIIGVTQEITERKRIETEREEALREAQEWADQDPLTGLINHRVFHNRFEQEALRAQKENTNIAVVVLDLDNFKFFNDCYGHAIGDEVLRLVAQRLQTVCHTGDTVARFGGDEFALLLPGDGHTIAADVAERLARDLADLAFVPGVQGTAIPITVSLGVALFTPVSADRHEILRQADENLLRAKTGGVVETEAQQVRVSALQQVQGFSMLDALVTAVDNKDRYTRKHSEDVMTYSLQIARGLEMDEATQRTVAVAALLHDVGKIGVPDAILRKPGKLTDEEYKAIKQHPQMGAIMVGAVPGLENTLDAVRHHHERWDGEGYPFGLRDEETPVIARLMAVADAFSAMTTDRPYRKGMDREKARGILKEGSGTQWDPDCVRVFLAVSESGVC